MKIACSILVSFISIASFAGVSKDCKELNSEQIRLATVGSNLANVNTTQTPEGGPYRPYIINSCSNGGCDIERDNSAPMLKYLPGHPDANQNGYVAFPYIDQKSEYATFNMTAIKLKLLAVGKKCGASVTIDNGSSSFLIRYSSSRGDVKEDIFNLNRQNQIVSWMRQDSKGTATTLNFGANGEVTSYR